MNIPLLSAVSAVVLTLGLVTNTNAALVSRLGGQAVYDEDLDITWIADMNLAQSNKFGVGNNYPDEWIYTEGWMDWNTANSWIAAMNAANYLGYSDWRLPVTPIPDTSCESPTSGYGCTASELGHLFYQEFGAVAGQSVLTSGRASQLALFDNLQDVTYWSSEYSEGLAESFNFSQGYQGAQWKSNYGTTTWAVRSGDVSAVPVPAAAWLFGSGLIGLLGVMRRRH